MAATSSKPDRRSERSKQAILDATRELLAEEGGVKALTIEAVAARSGVAKTTIYRRWRDKWELALDAAMIDILPSFDDPVNVGDTRKELITFVNSALRTLGSKPYGPRHAGPRLRGRHRPGTRPRLPGNTSSTHAGSRCRPSSSAESNEATSAPTPTHDSSKNS